MRPLDARWAARSAALLYGAGTVLLVTAAFLEDASARPGILGLAGLAAVTALLLVAVDRAGRATATLAFAAEVLAVAIVAALVAQTGGAQSLYPAYYLLPVLHAAVFPGRLRALAVGGLALAGFLAPLAYESGDVSSFA